MSNSNKMSKIKREKINPLSSPRGVFNGLIISSIMWLIIIYLVTK